MLRVLSYAEVFYLRKIELSSPSSGRILLALCFKKSLSKLEKLVISYLHNMKSN